MESCAISLPGVSPSAVFPKTTRILKELNISIPPTYLWTLFIDGIQVSPNGVSFKQKVTTLLYSNGWTPEMLPHEMCLNAKLDTDTWQFISLKEHFDQTKIQEMANWINANNQKLLNIGTEFELYDRQIYFFLYEIIALFFALKTLPIKWKNQILADVEDATSLCHGRILAEIVADYKETICVKLHPTFGQRVPDLQINNILTDVKTILLTGKDRHNLMIRFANRLRKVIIEDENKKSQVGDKGSFVIGIWSGIINSIIYVAYKHGIISAYNNSVKLSKHVPPLKERKVIFVMPTTNTFQNIYITFDRDTVCNTIDYLSKAGYSEIPDDEPMKYFEITNIRTGCEFGITADNPTLLFKFR